MAKLVKRNEINDLCVKVSPFLLMIFKLDNVTSLTAARWAAAEGFDSISFNFDKSNPSYIQPMQVAEICKWVSGIRFTGSFLNVESSVILDLYDLLNLDAIEIDLKTAEILMNNDIPTIFCLEKNDFKSGLEFQKFNPHIFAFSLINETELPFDFPIEKSFISSKFENNILQTIPFGISFNSANETEPGLIDFEELGISLNKWQKMA
ncbi:MAG: hypothetical protein ACKVQB_06750 [Bacteroidia bacterium]